MNRTPIIKVAVYHPSDASKVAEVDAVLDTGCTGIAVSEELSKVLSLPIIETRMAHTASSGRGGEPTPVALANLELLGHDKRMVKIQSVEVMIMKKMLSPMLLWNSPGTSSRGFSGFVSVKIDKYLGKRSVPLSWYGNCSYAIRIIVMIPDHRNGSSTLFQLLARAITSFADGDFSLPLAQR